MAEKNWVDNEHYRVVSDDGKTSYLYKADGGLFHPDSCIEIAEHHEDGTTDAYEVDNSILGGLLHGCSANSLEGIVSSKRTLPGKIS